ncbi:MAG: hypothetical protein ACOY5F_06740 [Pseudomonadota bacterium]
MAEHPDLDRQTEQQPLPGEVERERADISVVSILAVLALIVAGGLWFFAKDREMVAGDGTTVKQTTGSGSQQLPSPNRPQLPAPSPSQPSQH